MKACKGCGEIKPLSEYYTHKRMSDGHLNFCKSCVRSRVTNHRSENLEAIRQYDRERSKMPKRQAVIKERCVAFREAHPEKYHAHSLVASALRCGRLAKKPCEVCADPEVHAHHTDYSKPLDVIWLCAVCHAAVHHGQIVLAPKNQEVA